VSLSNSRSAIFRDSPNPDHLESSKKPAKFESFTDKHVLTDGNRPIEIHSIASNGHNDALFHGPRVVTLTDLKTAAGVIQQAAK